MANEKILNTRIGLKYDSLAKWTSSSIVLKAGEVAFATTAASAGNGLTEPVIMAKIGDGSKTFSQLDWSFYAKAADVHAWAKQDQTSFETYLKSFIGETIEDTDNNTTYAFAIVDGKLQITETPHVLGVAGTPVVSSLDFVTPDELTTILGNYYTKEEVGEQITAAIEALDSSASQEAGADGLALSVTAADGKITAISGSIAANTYDAHGAASTAKSEVIGASGDAKTADTVYGAKAYADDAAAAALEDANEYTDGEIDKVETELAKVVDGTTPVAKATNADQLGGVAAADYALKSYADQAEADAVATAKAYTDDMKDAILGEGISDTFDTLVEIQNWINGAGVNATELSEAIAAEAKLREDGDKAVQDQIDALGITDGKVASAATADVANSLSESAKAEVKAVKVDNATNADVANSLTDTAKAEVKAVKVDNATNADKAADADKLGGVVAADYALKTEAQGYANTAEQNAKDYVDGLTHFGTPSHYITFTDEQGIDIHGMGVTIEGDIVKMGGYSAYMTINPESSTTISVTGDMQVQAPVNDTSVSTKKYVDDALAAAKKYADDNDTDTTYTAKADGGLKLEGTEFSIDDSLTWIFDCGTSAN